MSVTGEQSVTADGLFSLSRVGPRSLAEAHSRRGGSTVTASVGWRDRPARDTLSVTLEEAELLALALAEAVALATEEEEPEE